MQKAATANREFDCHIVATSTEDPRINDLVGAALDKTGAPPAIILRVASQRDCQMASTTRNMINAPNAIVRTSTVSGRLLGGFTGVVAKDAAESSADSVRT